MQRSLLKPLSPRSAALSLLAVVWLWAGEAAADDLQGSDDVATLLDVELTGNVTSSVFIELDGSVDLTSNLPTTVTGFGDSGFVNFGTITGAGPVLTGEKHRVNKKGNFLVATMAITVRLSGGAPSATLDVQRTYPTNSIPDDIADANLFYAQPTAKNVKLAWPVWNTFPDVRFGSSVFNVPDSTFTPGTGNLDAAMVNGDTIDHQIAIWIPDAQAPSSFSTTVTYTATAN
jgi:hypothetical protein